jgi:hypothetical protein
LERDTFRAGLNRADLLRLDFVRESRARRFGVRFAVMAAFYVNCGVPVTQASIANVQSVVPEIEKRCEDAPHSKALRAKPRK